MTLEHAKSILARPRFADPQCLAAKKRVEDEPKRQDLINWLEGKAHVCPACGGDDDDCSVCEGLSPLPRRSRQEANNDGGVREVRM